MDPHFAVLIDSSPTVIDGMVLIGVAGFELAIVVPQRTFRGSVVALDDDDGSELWRTYTTNDERRPLVPTPTRTSARHRTCSRSMARKWSASAASPACTKIFDRDTGEELTQFQLTTAVQIALSDPNIPDAYATAYIGGIMGSAAVANGILTRRSMAT